MKWSELIDSGDLTGYTTSGIHGTGRGMQIDKEVAEETPCDKCGGKCEYIPIFNKHESYRAFAVCTKCKETIEF